MLLTNGITISLSPARIRRMDLRVEEGSIVATGKSLRPRKGEEIVDLTGTIIMPGMVNAHTHLYSSLSRGMPGPAKAPRNFSEILGQIWWKLDTALDEEAVHYSALVGSLEALQCGTTTLVDHHASPNAIDGSLDIIKKAMCSVGMRGILCYETTDRGGSVRRDRGLEENERFVTENANNLRFRGAMGAHASFTLNDDTLRILGDLAGMYDCGVHIHVAEDKADVRDAVNVRQSDIITRLKKFGIAGHKSIFAHGIHLSKHQLAVVASSGTWMVHNPRSNMNNGVGYAPLAWFGEQSAIGTDGFASDMFEEGRVAFLRNQESSSRVQALRILAMLNNGQQLVSQFFGRKFGSLQAGSPADIIVLEYASPTPMTEANLVGHALFGLNSGAVRHAMVEGEWRMWNREFVGIDSDKVMTEARIVATKLWKRMRKASR
jgi:putative selenium metabolism protein SsnA